MDDISTAIIKRALGRRSLPDNPQQLSNWLAAYKQGESLCISNLPRATAIKTRRLWVVTTHFNPAGYKSLSINYNRFAQHIAGCGLNLLTAELSYPGQRPTLFGSGVIHFTAQSIMWHKERLLNLAIRQLPPECDMVAWVDADVLFTNHRWVQDTIAALERVPVAQLFEQCIMMDCQGNYYQHAYGFAFSLTSGFLDNPRGNRYTYHNGNFKHPGFAWAARRKTIDAWGGLYDRHILGGGDYQMALAIANDPGREWYGRFGPKMQSDMQQWSSNCSVITHGSVSYVPGMITHMWHGHSEDRQYVERTRCLVDYDFDPHLDIAEDVGGLWRWNSDKPQMQQKVANYFSARKDDSAIPIHPTRYSDKYPIVLDPEGGYESLNHILDKLCELQRTDFCAHIACTDWRQWSKLKPLVRDHQWPYQVKAISQYSRTSKQTPRRFQIVRHLGPESNAKQCLFVDRNTQLSDDFIHRVTGQGTRVVVDQSGKLLMADRSLICLPAIQSSDEHGTGEERVLNYAHRHGIRVGTIALS